MAEKYSQSDDMSYGTVSLPYLYRLRVLSALRLVFGRNPARLSLREAGAEALLELLAVQVAPDEHHAVDHLLVRPPLDV